MEDRPVGNDLLARARDALAPKRGDRRRNTDCKALGCGQATSEGKPFCFDHLLLHPYAAAVQAALRARRELGPRDVEADRRQRMRERYARRRAEVAPGM